MTLFLTLLLSRTETQAAALVIGWTKETWDDDWHIRDFPIEHKYWSELTDEQKAAATHFGYTRITWDMTDEVRFEDDGSAVSSDC